MTPLDPPPIRKPRRNWLSFSLRSLLIVTTLICVGIVAKQQYDWRRKRALIHEWIAPLVAHARAAEGDVSRYQYPEPKLTTPAGLTIEEEIAVLMFGVLESETPEERFAALEVLVETRRGGAVHTVRELLPRSQRHPELQAVLLRLLAFARDPDDLARLEPYLENGSPEIRAAAAESIGFLRAPAYEFDVGFLPWDPAGRLNTLPPVRPGLIHPGDYSNQAAADQQVLQQTKEKWPPRVRERIDAMMLTGPTELERTAAARALVSWPPDSYSLRVAEWGVWIDSRGNLELAKSVLVENPPFVHGAGNPLRSLTRNRARDTRPMIVTKPILHLTTNQPLAVDLEVAIREGRPWYVYPRPDTFTVHIRGDTPSGAGGDGSPRPIPREWRDIEASTGWLTELWEGYPWLHPKDRSSGEARARNFSRESMLGVGFRWQSLIVSPERQAWATPPEVPAEPRYQWWEALREVPSSWITSRSETERFLYYDGPTMTPSPLTARWRGNELQLTGKPSFFILDPDIPPKRVPSGVFTRDYTMRDRYSFTIRDLLLVDATHASPRACALQTKLGSFETQSLPLDEQTWLTGDAIEQSFRDLLHKRGLTAEEAEGLIFAWRERFFHNPGRRLISLLTPEEYDRLCPLKIRPAATQTVRVGIVLTEFK